MLHNHIVVCPGKERVSEKVKILTCCDLKDEKVGILGTEYSKTENMRKCQDIKLKKQAGSRSWRVLHDSEFELYVVGNEQNTT